MFESKYIHREGVGGVTILWRVFSIESFQMLITIAAGKSKHDF
jgi:hypothetical protein